MAHKVQSLHLQAKRSQVVLVKQNLSGQGAAGNIMVLHSMPSVTLGRAQPDFNSSQEEIENRDKGERILVGCTPNDLTSSHSAPPFTASAIFH